jgi:hypothetical protein
MAKMTRGKLKGIVKECLLEILSEGLETSSASSLNESKNVQRKRRAMKQEEARLAAHRQKFETRVTDTVSHITDDPIMRSILADTAKTTLQEQVTNDTSSQVSNDMVMQDTGASAAGIDLSGIFGSSKQNWSDLAFTKSESD